MIDLHSHILPGVDDGARTLAESLEIARAAVADGITTIACTPHVRDDYPTEAGVMEEAVAELRSSLEQAEIPLEIRPGGEVAFEWLDKLPVDELRRFGLGGNPGYLLVETPYYGWPLGFADRLFSLRSVGITPVLAHPERNAEVQAEPRQLDRLVRAGVLVQVTAASIDGRTGRRALVCGLDLIEQGLAHLLASDAHHASVRSVGIAAATKKLNDDALAGWLTQGIPTAILGGEPLPPRPESTRKRGWIRKVLRT
jgi:protein-tyrosine phosphatase